MSIEAVAALMIRRGQQVPVDMIIKLQEMGHNFDARQLAMVLELFWNYQTYACGNVKH